MEEFISRKDRNRIERAITAAEKKTSGEIIAVVAESSDLYMFLPIMWAALLALFVPLVLFWFTTWPGTHIYAV